MSRLFCPTCSTLLLAAPRCPACGWVRPAPPEPGHALWRLALGLAHGTTPLWPAVSGAVWWLPSEAGDLVGVEAQSGAWHRVLRPDMAGYALALAATERLLLVGLCDPQPIPAGARPLLALDGRSGDELWRHPTTAHSLSAAAVAADAIYFTSSDERLHALSLDGAPRWSVPHPGWGPTPPAVAAGVVVAGGRDYSLCGYDAATGERLWSARSEAWLAGPIVAAGGRVFTLAFDGALLAFDLASGAPLWQLRGERASGFTSPPAAHGERVYIGDRVAGPAGAKGYALRALRAADGAELGRAPLARHLQVAPALLGPPGGELLLCCADDGVCLALDPARLSERWRYAAGRPFVATPVAVGELAVLAFEGGVSAVQLRAADAPADPAALLAAGMPQAAADAYALQGDLGRAAELYAGAGLAREAAMLYERAARAGEAAAQWEQAGDPERARRLLEAAGDRRAAAASYERSGELARALTIYRDASAWAEVAALAARLNLPAEEAAARERLGDLAGAAAAYERAARQAAALGDDGTGPAADLLVHAVALYEQAGDGARARACRDELGRLRGTPDLTTVVKPRYTFVEQEWNELDVELRNAGFGPAREVTISVGGPSFDSSLPAVFKLIGAGETQRAVMRLRPRAGEVGQGVPLTLSASYADSRGQPYHEREEVSLVVTARGSVAQPSPPLAFTAGGGRAPERATERRPLAALELPLALRFDAPAGAGSATIRWEAETIGSLTSSFRPPYSGADLALVISALDELQSARRGFSAAELDRLAALGLPVVDGQLHPQAHQAVGRAIFNALTADPEGETALSTIRNVAIAQSRAAVVRLHFTPAAASLAALPWELAWDESDEPLLLSRGQLIGCVRHLDLAQALPPPRSSGRPLRLTAVTPAAGLAAELRAEERAARLAALAPLVQRGDLLIDEVAGPVTRRALNDHVRQHGAPDIVHFVGHGRYLEGQGYLVLDTPEGGFDPVPASKVVQLLSQARLVVLHACQSGATSAAGLLTGVAPALSAAGVPAVVAMQLAVRVAAAVRFAEELYGALARGESLQRAVSLGRQVLFAEEQDGASWYVPTLTVRARDPSALYLFGDDPSRHTADRV